MLSEVIQPTLTEMLAGDVAPAAALRAIKPQWQAMVSADFPS